MLMGRCCTLSQIPPGNILFEIDIKQGDIILNGFFLFLRRESGLSFYLQKY